jgi:DNA-directed RNA polymerase I subunit RPA2|tara:strand:- start:1006 stop:3891 length:2886 start_codon:yes stop_codon:yes gene_type:complete
VRLHYLSDGTARVAFVYRRQEYFVPAGIIVRALSGVSDFEIQSEVTSGIPESRAKSFASERMSIVLKETSSLEIKTRNQALNYLGSQFRGKLEANQWETNVELGHQLLENFIFVHLNAERDRFKVIILMFQKLYSLVTGSCSADDPDSLMHHEILLPGYLLQIFVREKLHDLLKLIKEALQREWTEAQLCCKPSDPELLARVIAGSISKFDIGKLVEYFIATGNLASRTGLGLSQSSGFTIVADKLNYMRYLSHFRSVHRGAYFSELRTTAVRKLLPESWGFMCPVHTPDGSPCGLLNHLSASCFVVVPHHGGGIVRASIIASVHGVLAGTGVIISHGYLRGSSSSPQHLPVTLDGAVVGSVRLSDTEAVIRALRAAKVSLPPRVPPTLEVGYIPPCEGGGAFPGLFLFTSPARLMRPVKQLSSGCIELISSLEQVFMSIKFPGSSNQRLEAEANFTHEETGHGAMLSEIASCTPWSDYNQSPRNMYQCQMGKQTMGVPVHSFQFRPDTKLYRLQTPQRPLALTETYDVYHIDDYPLGTNAVVAVIAYTGYDMEDAMIVNRSSMQRGLAHATLYKTELFSAVSGSEESFGCLRKCSAANSPQISTVSAMKTREVMGIDSDGTPAPGSALEPGDTIASVANSSNGHVHLHRLKGKDLAIVDRVSRMFATGNQGRMATKVGVTLRFNRNPVVGDKFSSRHGQKGVLSFLWPEEDLPFVERTGIRPDILINPHAFPSRMTIGMLVESMASKSGALDGSFVDASPFKPARDGEKFCHPVQQHGKILQRHGYSYHGSETLISGLSGERFEVDIFIGMVYYQRLRHMVSDKFQVRSLGPNNPLTQQPIKGRSAGGGIRFGEMERDSLLAHGAAYLIHDRLHACSDHFVASICSHCGSLLSPSASLNVANTTGCEFRTFSRKLSCRICSSGSGIQKVPLPFVFKYLTSELASMNIRIGLEINYGIGGI